MEEAVSKWLDESGFSEYKEKLRDEGYDDLETISEVNENDLEDLGISKKGHVKKFLLKVKELKNTLREERIARQNAPQKKTTMVQSVLPCSTRQAIPDDAPYQKSKWFYTNPRHPRTRYFNEILPQIYTVARPHMSESAFESYLFTEREKRWKLKGAIEKLEHNVSYLLSDKNPACFGQYTTPHIHPTPKDLNNCKRGIQELSSIKADVDAKLIQLSGEYQGLFDDKGNKCKKWASEQKLYCESLNEKLSCLKQKLSKALTDIENNLTPSAQALSRFSAAKGKKRTRSQKENRRKAKKRKEERFQSAVYKTMKSITLDLWTIENLCFPEGYNISSTSQHSLCEEELNIDNFDSLGRSAAEHLTIMKNQGLFALDAFEVVDNTIQRICYLDEA